MTDELSSTESILHGELDAMTKRLQQAEAERNESDDACAKMHGELSDALAELATLRQQMQTALCESQRQEREAHLQIFVDCEAAIEDLLSLEHREEGVKKAHAVHAMLQKVLAGVDVEPSDAATKELRDALEARRETISEFVGALSCDVIESGSWPKSMKRVADEMLAEIDRQIAEMKSKGGDAK